MGYYKGVDPVIDHDHGNPPGLLKHSEAKPQLPPISDWENITTSERTVKCIAVTDFYSDAWCVQNCAMKNCPQDGCVCDWMGTWPEDDTEFANWDISSLGIGGMASEATFERARAAFVAPWSAAGRGSRVDAWVRQTPGRRHCADSSVWVSVTRRGSLRLGTVFQNGRKYNFSKKKKKS